MLAPFSNPIHTERRLATVLSALHMLAAFIVAIVLLVSLHELGHLVVARLCGIKVLRFSVRHGQAVLHQTLAQY